MPLCEGRDGAELPCSVWEEGRSPSTSHQAPHGRRSDFPLPCLILWVQFAHAVLSFGPFTARRTLRGWSMSFNQGTPPPEEATRSRCWPAVLPWAAWISTDQSGYPGTHRDFSNQCSNLWATHPAQHPQGDPAACHGAANCLHHHLQES